jgi:hypothetical protein
MCVIDNQNRSHPYAASGEAGCSFCGEALRPEAPYVAWYTGEHGTADGLASLYGNVEGGTLFICPRCCHFIRSGILEDMERASELAGYPRKHETIHSLRRWKAAGGGWRPGLLTQ